MAVMYPAAAGLTSTTHGRLDCSNGCHGIGSKRPAQAGAVKFHCEGKLLIDRRAGEV